MIQSTEKSCSIRQLSCVKSHFLMDNKIHVIFRAKCPIVNPGNTFSRDVAMFSNVFMLQCNILFTEERL